jgi:hypothetical protein
MHLEREMQKVLLQLCSGYIPSVTYLHMRMYADGITLIFSPRLT